MNDTLETPRLSDAVPPNMVSISDEGQFRHEVRNVEKLSSARSLNNRFILEAYTGDRSLKAKETSGFAMLSQKVNLVGLKVLVDTKLADGTFIRAGAKAYLKEELVFTQPWGKNNMECPDIQGKFIIVDATFVEFVVPA